MQEIHDFRVNCLNDENFISFLNNKVDSNFVRDDIISINYTYAETTFGTLDINSFYVPLAQYKFDEISDQLFTNYAQLMRYDTFSDIKQAHVINKLAKQIIQPELAFEIIYMLLHPKTHKETYRQEYYIKKLDDIKTKWKIFNNDRKLELLYLTKIYNKLSSNFDFTDDDKILFIFLQLIEPFHIALTQETIKKYTRNDNTFYTFYTFATLYRYDPFIYFNYDQNTMIDILTSPTSHCRMLIWTKNKIMFYDPDECEDFDKISKILKSNCGLQMQHILNKKPIQTITDDGYCLFWCLYIMLQFENGVSLHEINTNLNKINMTHWIKALIKEFRLSLKFY